MNKKMLLIALVFIAAALSAFIANADEANKCCLNPNVDSTNLCRTDINILENECCPADGVYWERGPASQEDCRQNYYKNQNCNLQRECTDIGCCCPEGAFFFREPQCRPSSGPNDRFFTYNDYKVKANLPNLAEDEFYEPSYCAQTVCQRAYTPPASGTCDTFVPEITHSSPIKGEKAIRIAWNDKCKSLADRGLLAYKIERCEGQNCNLAELQTTSQVSFRDENVEWEKEYTYRVTAVYGSINYQGSAFSVSTGNVECWGVKDENNFCINPSYYQQEPRKDYPGLFLNIETKQLKPIYTARWNKAFKCSAANVLQPVKSCSAGTTCVVIANTPNCYSKSACRDSGKPLGLYDKKAACEAAGYCFYDRSATTVDACYPCNETMSCYDYKSQQACLKDNCGVRNCEWKYTYSELGIGVCVDKVKNNCANCESKGTEGTANLLAYNEIYDSCAGGLRQKKISALSTDNAPCTGMPVTSGCADITCRNYDEANCNQDDRCSIRVCRWYGSPDTGGHGCRKDADNSINPTLEQDCDLSETGIDCEKDYFAPETTMTPAYQLGSISRFNIDIQDKKAFRGSYAPIADSEKQNYITYLCNGLSNACSLPFNLSVRNSEVAERTTLSTLVSNGIISLDQQNLIKYHSVDPNKNVESVKELNILIPRPAKGMVIIIRKPGYRTTYSSSVEVEGQILNRTRITNLKIKVNSGAEQDILEGLSDNQIFTATVNLDTTSERTENTIRVSATDADNFATSGTIRLIYDRKEPTGTITFE